jgi:H+/Cl- antiporter ClcA
MLDNYYISILKYYKGKLGRRSLNLALFYINFLELSVLLLLGTFFMAFARQMKLMTMSSYKFWTLFLIVGVFVIFKNWMRFNGKKRNVLNAKFKSKPMSIYLIWTLPFASLLLAFVLYQVK